MPAAARAHACELVRLGRQMANTGVSPGPFGNEADAIMDNWRDGVMPAALERIEHAGGARAALAEAARELGERL